MKHIAIALAFVLSLLFSGCRVMPTNGDLDAQWQITSLVINETGEETHPDQLFYNFYRDLVQLTGNKKQRITGEIAVRDNTISINFPMVNETDAINTLSPWGINSTTITFAIVQLNSKHMILKSDYSTVTFRKF